MSLRAQAIDSPGTFLRGRLCGPVADGQFWLQGMRWVWWRSPGARSVTKRRILHAYGATSRTGMLADFWNRPHVRGRECPHVQGWRNARMSEVGSVAAPFLWHHWRVGGYNSFTSISMCRSIPCQSVVLFYFNPFEYVDLGAGREARHRKQTENSKIINDAKRLYI